MFETLFFFYIYDLLERKQNNIDARNTENGVCIRHLNRLAHSLLAPLGVNLSGSFWFFEKMPDDPL